MDSETAIKVEKLSKVFKLYNKPTDRLKEAVNPFKKKYHTDFYALRDLTFEIKKGETVGIIGKNGSGKSTLLQIITGIISPTSGSVQTTGNISSLLELGAGFNPELTGIENVYLNGAIMGYSKEEMAERLEDIISFADIGDFIYRPVKTYSSGMYVRLAFACAINVNPDILIIDEALAVGDLKFQLKCINKMKALKKEGKTILFVSHSIYQVRNFCNQAIWLMDGQIHLRGDVNSVTERYEDFMKDSETENGVTENNEMKQDKVSDYLTIDKVSFLNEKGISKNVFSFGEQFRVVINYTLHVSIEGVVGGVAIYDKENTYICGLNTKLDNYSLPSKPGKYQLILSYYDISLLPGTYFIDIGFFESSAVVQLDYKSRCESFRIDSGKYLGEGLFLIKHCWQCKGEEKVYINEI